MYQTKLMPILGLCIAAAAMCLFACEGVEEDPAAAAVCTPGQVMPCDCGGGITGNQTCDGAGAAFGTCVGCPSTNNGGSTAGGGGTGACAPSNLQASSTCENGAVVWVDDCGNQGAIKETCPAGWGCQNGACVQGCQSHAEQGCVDNNVTWIDSCGNAEEMIQACTGGAVCVAGECKTDCTTQAAKYCLLNTITWYDSCGFPGLQETVCQSNEVCVGCTVEEGPCATTPSCQAVDFNGSWTIVGNPPATEACGGTVTLETMALTVNVAGTQATATMSYYFTPLEYVGTAIGDELTLTTDYTEDAPFSMGSAIEHTHLLTLVSTGGNSAEGTLTDTGVPNSGDVCVRSWNILATRQ